MQLVHEMLGASVTTGDAWMNVECGQPLRVPSRVDAGGAAVTSPTLVDEQGAAYPLAATPDDVRNATVQVVPVSGDESAAAEDAGDA